MIDMSQGTLGYTTCERDVTYSPPCLPSKGQFFLTGMGRELEPVPEEPKRKRQRYDHSAFSKRSQDR